MYRPVAVMVALALVTAACGGGNVGDTTTSTIEGVSTPPTSRPVGFTPGELISVDLPRVDPAVTAADIAAVVAGDRRFAWDLFSVVADEGNTMVSPYSVATALAMLYPGTRGDTAAEIAEALGITIDDAAYHGVRNHIETVLARPTPPSGGDDTRAPFTIRPANSAWGQGGYPFLDDYLGVLAQNYGAGLRVLDYIGDPDGSRTTINDWVSDATEDRINDLIPPGGITPDTRLTLVNAIWFKANWHVPFAPDNTRPGPFTLLDGSTVDVPLMHADLRTGYAESERWQALRLPYAGDAAMVVMIPRTGTPAELAATLTPSDMDIAWGDGQVDVTLPSFSFDADVDLTAALQALGVSTAFVPPTPDGGADLTGITEQRELFVSGAFHKTFIAVDEEGTEAAAATALVVGVTSMPEPATFTADRPFLFWIEHGSTGEPLFVGQVTDPR